MDLLLYLAGGALLVVAMRLWRGSPAWTIGGAFLLLGGLLFAAPLTTGALQVGTDLAEQWRPWSESFARQDVVSPSNPLLSDVPLQMLPFRTLVRERMLHGQFPLWAHELATGEPLAGNAQAAPLALLPLLALVRPPLRALAVVAAWQTLLGLLLMDGLLAALGAGRWGRLLGALAYAWSVYAICWAYYPIGMAAMWLPGVLLGLLALRRNDRGALPGLAVCAVGLATSGHPETLALATLAAVVWTAGLLVRQAAGERPRFLLQVTGAAILTGCLSAPALIPILAAVPESARAAAFGNAPAAVESAPVFTAIVDPLAEGSPRDGNWTGDFNFNELCSGYAGLVPLAVALVAAVLLGGKPRYLMLGGGLALLIASRVPPFYALFAAIPGLDLVVQGRLRLFWVLAIALASGLGFDELLRRPLGRRGIVVGLALLALALGLLPPPANAWQRAWWIVGLCGATMVALALAFPALRRFAPGLAVLALAGDLGTLNGHYLPAVAARDDLAEPLAARELADRVRSEGQPFRVLAQGADLMPNLGALYGLWDPRGNDPMLPQAASLVVGRGFRPRYQSAWPISLAAGHFPQPLLDMLAVRYLLTRHRERVPAPWEPVWNDQGGRIWRNPEALGLFYVPRQVRVTGSAAEALLLTLSNPDFAAAAIVEERPSVAAMARLGRAPEPTPATESDSLRARLPATDQRGRIVAIAARPDGFVLEVEMATEGFVASSVSWSRGWRMAQDGEASSDDLPRINAGFLGLRLPSGHHRVLLTYRPQGWSWAVWAPLAGALGAALAGLARRHRRRGVERSAQPSAAQVVS